MNKEKIATPPPWHSGPLIDWIMEKGRLISSVEEMLYLLGHQLSLEGAPITRIRLSMRTLHPLVTAHSLMWESGSKHIQTVEAPHGLEKRKSYRGSPLEIVSRTGKPYRIRLDENLTDSDHSILHELRTQGLTDYYSVPLHFSFNMGGVLVFNTNKVEGFSERDIHHLRRIAYALAPVAEVANSTKMTMAITNSYLGNRTGKLVLNGSITRGHIETIEAAIMVSDVRDWTRISNTLPPQDSLDLVNTYFDVIAKSVEENDGEILKFIGDGVLAVFPMERDGGNSNSTCANSLKAAQRALNTKLPEDLSFGIGLHFGKVLYGNIGAEARLDFTVLGEAVNRTARIESLCKRFGRPLLFSEEFADQIPSDKQLLDTCELKGFEGIYKIYSTNW